MTPDEIKALATWQGFVLDAAEKKAANP